MSTRSAIAYPYGDGWRGRYVHSDGYPTCRGKEVWAYLNARGFDAYRDLIDTHSAGLSWMPAPDEAPHGETAGERAGACYAAWGRPDETDSPKNPYIQEHGRCSTSCDPLFIEWAYVADASGALTILASYQPKNRKRYKHAIVWTGRWDRTEPDWQSIENLRDELRAVEG